MRLCHSKGTRKFGMTFTTQDYFPCVSLSIERVTALLQKQIWQLGLKH